MRWHKKMFYGFESEAKTTCYVVGAPFTDPVFACGVSLQDAINEFDERHGIRVQPQDVTVHDYENGIEGAMNCGDVRVNDGGTIVWVDPNEYFRQYASLRDAIRAECTRC